MHRERKKREGMRKRRKGKEREEKGEEERKRERERERERERTTTVRSDGPIRTWTYYLVGVRARTVQPTAGVATLPRPNMRAPCYIGVGGERVKRRGGDAGAPHACVPAYHDPSWQERTNPVLSTRIPTHSTRAHTCAHVHTDAHHLFRPLTLGPAPLHRANHPPPTCSSKPTTHTHPTAPLHRPTPVTMENMNLGQIPAAVP